MEEIMVHYVDDLESNLFSIKLALKSDEHHVSGVSFILDTFSSDTEFYSEAVKMKSPDLVLLDIAIKDKRNAGLEMAKFAREKFPLATVVMYSQFDDVDTILKYFGAGVDEFLSKETPMDQIARLLAECHFRTVEKRRLAADSHDPVKLRKVTLVGKTMKGILEDLRRILQAQLRNVSVLGETGTGKEVVAGILQSLLPPEIPFITVNCGALTPSLLESQLFGHAKGAYTGANIAREGLFESASGGWVFLDEIADLSMAAQVALLRVIENQEVTRLGENFSRKVNVKILSASNQNLHVKAAEGTFRKDLIERISAHQIVIPPLRERKDEIVYLAQYFLNQIPNRKYHLAKTTSDLLLRYSWPTNIRELKNVVFDMATFASGDTILPSSLPKKIIEDIQRTSKMYKQTNNIQQETEMPFMAAFWDKIRQSDVSLSVLEDDLFLTYANIIMDKNEVNSLRSLAKLLGVSHPTVLRRLTAIEKQKYEMPKNVKQLWENHHD